VLLPVRPEFNRKETLSGTVISLDAADRFTLRDERGLDTIVLLFPETLYCIENPTGALSSGDAGMIKLGAKVTVEGLLNSDYQMKAVVIKTKTTLIRPPNTKSLRATTSRNPARNTGKTTRNTTPA
jgi:hypothetical protein